MKARFTILSGAARGRRLVLGASVITIGGRSAGTVQLRELDDGPRATVERIDGAYRIMPVDPSCELAVNGLAVAEAGAFLQDGDLIRIDTQKIRFSRVPGQREHCRPLRQIVRDSWRAAAHLDAGRAARGWFFLRDACHCTGHDATPVAKLGTVFTLAALIVASVVSGWSLMRARAWERRIALLDAKVAAEASARRGLEAEIVGRAESAVGEVSRQLETTRERLAQVERRTPDPRTSGEAVRGSIALLLVGYALYDKQSGRPLRFASVGDGGEPRLNERGEYETSLDGTGPVVTTYVTGTGFLIAGRHIVTNRHVAQPWWNDSSIEAQIARGLEPRWTLMRAYFPPLDGAIDLRPAAISHVGDVALLEGPVPGALTPLPLARPDQPVSTGDLIVVLGYPTGFDVLLAKVDEPVARSIERSAGGDWPRLADNLARRGLISPLVTIGHVGDVTPSNIVYDAATTHGSSGGPVLNAAGEVIALNYAGMERFSGARFGVPVRLVLDLLGGSASSKAGRGAVR